MQLNTLARRFPRLHEAARDPDTYAELLELLKHLEGEGAGALTADGVRVRAGAQVWVFNSSNKPTPTTVLPAEAVTNYYLFGQVPVSRSWSTEAAAQEYLRSHHE